MKKDKLKQMFPLFVMQFFTWLGFFSMWIYSVPVVAEYYFKNIKIKSGTNYDEATFWVGICFALYSILGTSLSFLVHKLIKKNNAFLVHCISLFIGAMGLYLMYYTRSLYILLFSFAFIGVAWSSVSSVPYYMVGQIANNEENSEKYYSFFNFSTVIPQVVAAFLLSFLTKQFFGGQNIDTILIGATSVLLASIIAGILAVKNPFNKMPYKQ